MLADQSSLSGPVPVFVVVQAPAPAQSPSPRTQRFNENLEKLGSLIGKMETFGKSTGEDLNKSITHLEENTSAISRMRNYEQERSQLHQVLQSFQSEMDNLARQLQEATKAIHASDKEKQGLLQKLESQRNELAAARKAVAGWKNNSLENDNQRAEESNRRSAAEERAREKEVEAQECRNQLQINRDILAMMIGRVRDREVQNQAMQAHNQALQVEIDVHRQEKANLEQAVHQQRAVLLQKEQHIQVQGQRIEGLEGRIQVQKGELDQIQKQVVGLKDGLKNKVLKAPERVKRISRVAIAVLIALSIALAVGLVFWLNPQLASATGSFFSRGWSALSGGAATA
ncbi:MAG: hypothetical protein LLG04_05735 [Parachlamydia sp.]|nr:hypothetical protein [Parachlamydia sp.]